MRYILATLLLLPFIGSPSIAFGDGHSIRNAHETIYRVTYEAFVSVPLTSDKNRNRDNYVPPGWTSEPPSRSPDGRFIWRSVRIFTRQHSSSPFRWSQFSKPSVFAPPEPEEPEPVTPPPEGPVTPPPTPVEPGTSNDELRELLEARERRAEQQMRELEKRNNQRTAIDLSLQSLPKAMADDHRYQLSFSGSTYRGESAVTTQFKYRPTEHFNFSSSVYTEGSHVSGNASVTFSW